MLEFQHVPINMTGVDTKTDDKNSVLGTFVTAENVYMLKTGKLQNRHGFKFPDNPITHSSEVIATVANGNGQISLERDGTYYFDENKGFSTEIKSDYSTPTIEYETFIPKLSIQSDIYYQSNTYSIMGTSISCGGSYGVLSYTIQLNATTFDTTFYLFNNESKVNLKGLSFTSIVTDFNPPICIDEYYIVYKETNTNLRISYLKPTSSTITTALATTAGSISVFDCGRSTNYLYVVEAQATTTKLISHQYKKSDRSTTNATLSSAYNYTKVAIAGNTGETEIYTLGYRGTTIDIFISSLGFVSTSSYSLAGTYTSVLQASISENKSDSSKLIVVLEYSTYSTVLTFNKADGTSLIPLTLYGYKMVSTINYPYILFYKNDIVLNSSYLLYDLQYNITLSTFLYGEVLQYYSAFYISGFSAYHGYCLTRFHDTYLPLIKLNNINTVATSSAGRTFALVYNTCKMNRTSNLAYMVNYNGTIITNAWGNLRLLSETNIASLPPYVSYPVSAPTPVVVDSVTAGSLTALGVYSYLVIYTYVDTNNNINYSSPLYATTHTLGVGVSSTGISIPIISDITLGKAVVTIYRTEASGSIFYFLTSRVVVSGTDYIYNDLVSDANLITNKVLYTTGDIIDSAPSPVAKFITIAKSRLWLISPENNDALYYSKKVYPNELPQFNSVYTLLVQNIGGDLQAIAEMDDKLIIFRRNAVFVTYGDGVDEIGNGSFAEPQLITMSLGCKYPRSIVLNDKGLFFMSYEGIYMITRGLTVEYVGAAVENYNSLTITQALNLVDRHQLWFMSAEGTTLVHDDYFGTWHTFTNEATYAASILNDDTPYYYRALAAAKYPGRLMLEDSTKYYDGAADNPIPVTLESGWISLAGIQGFQRLRTFTFVGNLNDTLTLKLYNDFETSENETFTVLPATVGTTPAQYQVKPVRQRTQNVKYKITLASLSAAFDISGLGIEAGIKKGTIRYDRSKRVSS